MFGQSNTSYITFCTNDTPFLESFSQFYIDYIIIAFETNPL